VPVDRTLQHQDPLPCFTSLLALDMAVEEVQEDTGHLPCPKVADSLLPGIHLDVASTVTLAREIFQTFRNDAMDRDVT
jgi:hypothetical protein